MGKLDRRQDAFYRPSWKKAEVTRLHRPQPAM
jgi:hypothetical protein